ncbi:hypothetical protein [Amycolatopsis sp. NPDC052450]|uniref:hypothetical protein n=1 Tax=Amycolatopsis sp. NPDC052450 TaxID=3363937 RepID=UPI0037C76E48
MRDTRGMKFGKLDARILGAILALAFILLIIMSVVLKQGADWWSAWGQWVGGIGSIGAAAVAVWIAVEGWRRSDREAKEKEERELATKVALWIEQTPHDPRPASRPGFVLKYINGGGMPIYKAEATVTFPNGPAPYIDTQLMLRPTTTPEDFARDSRAFNEILLAALFKERDLLRAELTHQGLDDLPKSFTPLLLDERYVDAALLMIINTVSITFTFTDANGVRWVRDLDGRLHREVTTDDTSFLPSLH